MHQKTKDHQKRYEGYLQTNSLWIENEVYDLNQFKIEPNYTKIDFVIDEKLRLGKYVERFVSFELQQDSSISILAENVQIQKEKRTIGELDCIILRENKPIHLEIIYKFYLYNDAVGKTELEHFIGPNKKDSLIDKLKKLKQKQLPLLYSDECLAYLKTNKLNPLEIKQEIFFKAQLFVPLSMPKISFNKINTNCIVGFYINKKELKQFDDCKFYIPIKKDWLLIPHKNVAWLTYNQFKEISVEYLAREFSPLCWVKKQNGEIKKFFLIWW